MKKWFYVSLILGMLPLTMTAQDDDMYFVPKKKSVERSTVTYSTPRSTYYSGSNRSVDEYNRRGGGSYYEVMPTDTTGNDIIDFNSVVGVYPDSVTQQQEEDFTLTRQMSRWDGYEPEVAYVAGYNAGRADSWHSPWYYSSYYPWYDSYWYWNDPWYYRHYGWYGSWYDPWYYDYYWHSPYWYGGYYYSYYRPYNGPHYISGGGGYHNRTHYDRGMVASTKRGVSNGRTSTYSAGTFGGAAIYNRNTATRNPNYQRNNTTTANRSTTVTNSHGTFAGNRTLGTTATSSSANRSTSSFGGASMSRSTSVGSSGSFGGGGGGGVTTRGGSRSSRR